ncbi:MAG: hypothetical protein AAGA38_18180 [Pseudomonadota bacterium]
MKTWSDFNHYASKYDGPADLNALMNPASDVKWLGDMVLGLQQISNSYQGDKNKRGDYYRASSGMFESMSFNGGASRSVDEYLFGITLGVPLRLTAACSLLACGDLSADQKRIFDYVTAADADPAEPADYEAVMAGLEEPSKVALGRSMTFFSLAFVWMHEAFHTLIGHVDFASEVLGLSLDELNMEDPGGFSSDVLQALELDADGASLTNFCLTLVQTPKFGIVADGNLDPAHRVAQAAEGAIIALAILELRRERLGLRDEKSHPNPSRRFANLMGMLRSFERRGMLPKGTVENLSRRIAKWQAAFAGSSVEALLDIVIHPEKKIEADTKRLSDLIKLGKSELAIFEETSFAPRVRPPGV